MEGRCQRLVEDCDGFLERDAVLLEVGVRLGAVSFEPHGNPWRPDDSRLVTLPLSRGRMAELCARYGISRKTGYTWLAPHRRGRPTGPTLVVLPMLPFMLSPVLPGCSGAHTGRLRHR